MGLWLALGDGLAQSLYFLLQGGHRGQGLLMGFPHLSEASLSGSVPPPPPGGFAPWRPDVSWHQVHPSSIIVHAPFCPRWSYSEDTILVASSSILSSSHGGDPGSLLSLYTSQYRALNSSLLVQGSTSWMVETSAFGSNFGRLCQWPQEIIHYASFCPCSAAYWNISWRMMGWLGLPFPHLAYPSRNIFMSIWRSVSLTDRPSLLVRSLAVRDFPCFSP